MITFANPKTRLRYEMDAGLLINEVSALAKSKNHLIILDEVQYLIDKKLAQFLLTGSSARKLKRNKNINLLPEAKQAYIICQTPNPIKIADNICALPWQDLEEFF